MSTKTTFKRIALVAVAALTLGSFSAVSASAATGVAVATSVPTVGTATSKVVLGATASSTVGFTTATDSLGADDQVYTNTTVKLVVPTGSTVSLADNDGAGAGTTAAFAVAGATANLVAAVDAASGAVTGNATADVTAGPLLAGTVSIVPDVVGTYKIVVTSGAATTATSTIYAANLWGEVGDGVTNGDQSNLTLNGVAGVANSATLSFRTTASTSRLITVTGSTINSFTTGTSATAVIAADKLSMVVTDDAIAEDVTFTVATPAAATITVSAFSQSQPGIYSSTAYGTVVITVNAAAVAGVVSATLSSAYLNATTGTSATADTASVTASKTLATAAATIPVALVAAVGTVAATQTTTATIVSGPGYLTFGGSTGRNITVTSATPGNVVLFADGNAGVTTITITAGAFTTTKTVTFFGSLASYKTVSVKKSALGIAETDAITYTGLDSNGVAATLGTVYASSSNTAVATVSVVGGVVTTTGVAAGTAVITVGNAVTAPTISTTLSYTVTKTTAKTVTLSFDKAEYTPGEKMVLTVTALDSTGAAVADGARNLFSAAGVTSTVNLVGTLPATSVTLVGGKATYTLYAPLASGPVTVSGTEGAATDNVIAAGTAATITASASVLSDGVAQAAADAAAEATDAANAATDAANAAAEAADAATAAAQDAADAVAALSAQVSAQILSLKKQITALTNLVIKIQKKVRA